MRWKTKDLIVAHIPCSQHSADNLIVAILLASSICLRRIIVGSRPLPNFTRALSCRSTVWCVFSRMNHSLILLLVVVVALFSRDNVCGTKSLSINSMFSYMQRYAFSFLKSPPANVMLYPYYRSCSATHLAFVFNHLQA